MRCADPWDEAERRANVRVELTPLPEKCGGAAMVERAGVFWILLDPLSSPVEQRCRLAHELTHLDRGSSLRCRWSPRSFDACIAREESYVDREVADWLVDDHELWIVVSDMVAADEDVTVREMAEHFQVTKAIARIALDRLARVHGLRVA